jgi:SAM-dependent methyltransferase
MAEMTIQTFKSFITEKIEHQKGSDTTQVAATIPTYKKAAIKLKEVIKTDSPKILDYGAGLGLGTAEIRNVFGSDNVDSYEPASGRSKVKPTFGDADEISGKYDGVICLNVLNVLEPALRKTVTKHILSLLKPGGYALIGTRKWVDDVNRAKNSEPADEPKAIWIKKGEQKVYQKGFDGNELVEYVSGLGKDLKITKVPGIAANAVLVGKN